MILYFRRVFNYIERERNFYIKSNIYSVTIKNTLEKDYTKTIGSLFHFKSNVNKW